MESEKKPEPPEEMEERYILPLESQLKTQTTTRSFEESWLTTATWVPTPPHKKEEELKPKEEKKEEGQ